MLMMVFTLGLPKLKRPEDSTFLIGFMVMGTLLNYYSLFAYSSSSSSSPLENASAKMG